MRPGPEILTALVLACAGCAKDTTATSVASSDRGHAASKEEPTAGKASATSSDATFGFEADTPGTLPDGWKIEATGEQSPLATWQVAADTGAKSGKNALVLTRTNHASGSTFNLCWTDRTRFQNGTIELAMKPISGQEDQGGGAIWRAKDKDDYYVCRANPLESNFRVYYVKGGNRHELASANADIAAGQWHTIQVVHVGDHITCSLDGKALLDAHDATFPDAGGVGFWTKSDAASAFDDLRVSNKAAHVEAVEKKKAKSGDKDGDGDDDDDDDKPGMKPR
jgi:hypothetical protein